MVVIVVWETHEVCLLIDAWPIVNNVCVDYLTVKNQWRLLTGDDGADLAGEKTMKDYFFIKYT